MAFTSLVQPTWETLLHVAEAVLNRLLAADPASPRRLTELAGCRLGVELTDIGLEFVVLFGETGLRFVPPALDTEGAPAARIRTSLAGLLTLAISSDRRRAKVEFSGEVGVVADIRRLFADLEVDWEEQIAPFTGDVVAYQLGRTAEGAANWLRRSGEALLQTIGEYLTEERRDLPAATQVSVFLAEVDCLHRDVEQLAARVRQLEQSLERGAGW